MKLPGGEDAIVDPEKLTGYCLNPEHPRGKHKARVFATALGFTSENGQRPASCAPDCRCYGRGSAGCFRPIRRSLCVRLCPV